MNTAYFLKRVSLLVLAGALLYASIRYWLGDFQGYATLKVGKATYGLAHIKGSTAWVSATSLLQLPEWLIFLAYASVFATFGFALRGAVSVLRRRSPRDGQGARTEDSFSTRR